MVQSVTQAEKDLLLKDLCARLPYGINCEYQGKVHGIVGFNYGKVTIYEHFQSEPKFPFIEEVKPYLFPMSNMTEEQKKEFDKVIELELKAISDEIDPTQATAFEVDYYNKHHFDWRGLIPMGLALDATGLNIY